MIPAVVLRKEKICSFVKTVVHHDAEIFHGGEMRSTGTTCEPAARSRALATSSTSGVTIVTLRAKRERKTCRQGLSVDELAAWDRALAGVHGGACVLHPLGVHLLRLVGREAVERGDLDQCKRRHVLRVPRE